MFSYLPRALQLALYPLLFTNPEFIHENVPKSTTFTLRHQHATANDTRILFHDTPKSFVGDDYVVKQREVLVHKPSSMEKLNEAMYNSAYSMKTDAHLWQTSTVPAPDVQDRETLLTLAKMTNNAYYEPSEKGWYDLGLPWNNTVRSNVYRLICIQSPNTYV